MKSIPRSLIDDNTYCVNLIVYNNNDGQREFVYMAVRRDNMPKFQQAIKRGNFDAEDYGVILEGGSEEPTDYIKNKMKILYKCNHDKALNALNYQSEEPLSSRM